MRFRLIAAALVIFCTVAQVAPGGQDGHAVITAATAATGAGGLRTVTLTGSGSQGRVGQNVSPATPWPQVPLKTYTRAVDVEAAAGNLQAVRLQNGAETPFTDAVAATAPWERRYQVWVTTPYVFLKAALANPVTVRAETVDGVRYTVVSLRVDNKYTVSGYVSEANLVDRIHTTVSNDVLGDMPVEGVFTDYRTIGGLKVPGLTIVKEGGFATLIAGVSDAKVNAAADRTAAPAATSAAGPPAQAAAAATAVAVTVATEKLADGVTVLRGGSHHSVLVEFADHLTLIEAPQNEARSVALLAAIKKLYPVKPLTQVVNTHHHFDHSGGLRTFVDAGAAVLTHEINRPFYLETFAAARTLSPDRLARSKRAAKITAVGDKLVLSDATRTVELHHLTGNPHAEGMLVAFLPKEKLLIEVDVYTPPAPTAPRPAADAPVNPNAVALVDTLERLRLDFDTVVPLHGTATAPRASLYEFIRKPMVPVSELPTAPAGRGGRGGRPPLTPLAPQPAAPGGAQP